LSMILWDNRCALCANAALRVRIMLWRRRRYTPKAPAARLGLREKRVQGLAGPSSGLLQSILRRRGGQCEDSAGEPVSG
jgi:hypothetical protein